MAADLVKHAVAQGSATVGVNLGPKNPPRYKTNHLIQHRKTVAA